MEKEKTPKNPTLLVVRFSKSAQKNHVREKLDKLAVINDMTMNELVNNIFTSFLNKNIS